MLQISAKTLKGLPEQNDDRIFVDGCLLTENELQTRTGKEYFLAAVCDGVGGRACGYQAAQTALLALSEGVNSAHDAASIQKLVYAANAQVMYQKKNCSRFAEMLTTMAGVYIDKTKIIAFNVGDSRVYRFRHKYLTQLSKDHSVVQDLLDLGEITPQQAQSHEKRNIITRCLGTADKCMPTVRCLEDDFITGDILLLCSDGLTDVLTNEQIAAVLLQHKQDADLRGCREVLISSAMEQGCADNISVILIRKE